MLFFGRFVLVKPLSLGELLVLTQTNPILCERPLHEVILRLKGNINFFCWQLCSKLAMDPTFLLERW